MLNDLWWLSGRFGLNLLECVRFSNTRIVLYVWFSSLVKNGAWRLIDFFFWLRYLKYLKASLEIKSKDVANVLCYFESFQNNYIVKISWTVQAIDVKRQIPDFHRTYWHFHLQNWVKVAKNIETRVKVARFCCLLLFVSILEQYYHVLLHNLSFLSCSETRMRYTLKSYTRISCTWPI